MAPIQSVNLTGKNFYRNLKIPVYLWSTHVPYEVLSLQYFQETLDIFTETRRLLQCAMIVCTICAVLVASKFSAPWAKVEWLCQC